MTKYFILLFILLSSCVLDVESNQPNNVVNTTTYTEVFVPSIEEGSGICIEKEIYTLEVEEGEIEIEISIMCEEFFIDKGNPPESIINEISEIEKF